MRQDYGGRAQATLVKYATLARGLPQVAVAVNQVRANTVRDISGIHVANGV
jgi:hypothetical protein